MIRRPPRSTQSRSSAASDVYKRQHYDLIVLLLFRLVLGDASPHAWRPSPADGTAAIAGRRPPRAAGRRPENDAVTAHATRRDGEDGGGQRSRRSARASRDGSRAVAS